MPKADPTGSAPVNPDQSTVLEDENLPATPPDENPESATPSTADEQNDAKEPKRPESLLDLVQSVVKGEEAEAEPDSSSDQEAKEPASEGNDTEAEGGTPEAKEEKPDEELPFHKHPRFQQVVAERRAFKQQAESLKGDAEQFRAISSYMQENNLDHEEVNQLFVFGTLLKSDPQAALEALTPIYEGLRNATGAAIPSDIQQFIEDGEMSEEAASSLARARAEAALAKQQAAAVAERSQRQAADASNHAIATAVTNWETKIAASDPDYEAKKGLTLKLIRLAHMERPARTPQEALAIAEAAYREASDTLKGSQPKRPEVKQPTAQQSATHSKPTPKTLDEVVRMAATGQLQR